MRDDLPTGTLTFLFTKVEGSTRLLHEFGEERCAGASKVVARRGEHAESEHLAREVVAICEKTDMLDAQGAVYADLAEVFLLAGKPDEAAASLEQAIERYERKGNLVSTARAQGRLAEVDQPAPQ
jgi:thioredoxin-like negative regulator of GroEL